MTIWHPLEAVPPAARQRTFVWLIAATLGFVAAFSVHDSHIRNSSSSGVLEFEFAGSVVNAQAIKASWSEPPVLAIVAVIVDFLFIPVYSTAFGFTLVWAAGQMRGRNWWRVFGAIAIILAWGQWLAGLLDIVENIALLRMLLGEIETPWPQVASYCAMAKFGLIALGLLYAGFGFDPGGLRDWLYRNQVSALALVACVLVLLYVPQISHVFFQLPCVWTSLTTGSEFIFVMLLYAFLIGLMLVYGLFAHVVVPRPAAAYTSTTYLIRGQEPPALEESTSTLVRWFDRLTQFPCYLAEKSIEHEANHSIADFFIAGGVSLWLVALVTWWLEWDTYFEVTSLMLFGFLFGICGVWFLCVVKGRFGVRWELREEGAKVEKVPRVGYLWNMMGRFLCVLLLTHLLGELLWYLPVPPVLRPYCSYRLFTIWGVLHALFIGLAVARIIDALHVYTKVPFRLIALLVIILGVASLGPVEVGEPVSTPANLTNEYLVQNWFDHFEQRLRAMDEIGVDGPVVFVAASGGGSRAALFSALMLEVINDINVPVTEGWKPPKDWLPGRKPKLSDHVALISSVSGGSLATAYYAHLRHNGWVGRSRARQQIWNTFAGDVTRRMVLYADEVQRVAAVSALPNAPQARIFADLRDQLQQMRQRGDSKMPVADWLLSSSFVDDMATDFMAPTIRGSLIPGKERGESLSRFWTRRFGWDDLSNPDQLSRHAPLFFLNSCDVYHGTRIVVSYPSLPRGVMDVGQRVTASGTPGVESAMALADFDCASTVSLAEGVRLSANFPFGFSTAVLPSSRGPMHLLDGGIVDNTGIDTITHLLVNLGYLANQEEFRTASVWSGVIPALAALPLGNSPATIALPSYAYENFPGSWRDWMDGTPAATPKNRLTRRAHALLQKLRERGILLLEIDSGAKPSRPSQLAETFPILFQPLTALSNASYANANLAKFDYFRHIEEMLREPELTDSAFFTLRYQCNHWENVMTAWALGPLDKAQILVNFLGELENHKDELSRGIQLLQLTQRSKKELAEAQRQAAAAALTVPSNMSPARDPKYMDAEVWKFDVKQSLEELNEQRQMLQNRADQRAKITESLQRRVPLPTEPRQEKKK